MQYKLTNKERKIIKAIHFSSNSSINHSTDQPLIQLTATELRIFNKTLEVKWPLAQTQSSDAPASDAPNAPNPDAPTASASDASDQAFPICLFNDLQKVIKKKKMAEPVYIDDSLPHIDSASVPHFSEDLSADIFLNKDQLNDLQLLAEFTRRSGLFTNLSMIHLQDQMLQACDLSGWYILDHFLIPLKKHFVFKGEYIKNLKCFSSYPVEIIYGDDHIGFRNEELEIRIKLKEYTRPSLFDGSRWMLDQKRISLPIHSEWSKKEFKQELTNIVKQFPKFVGKRYLISASLFSFPYDSISTDEKENAEGNAKKNEQKDTSDAVGNDQKNDEEDSKKDDKSQRVKMVVKLNEKVNAEGDADASIFEGKLLPEIRITAVDLGNVWRKDLKWSIDKKRRFLYEETENGVLVQRLYFLDD